MVNIRSGCQHQWSRQIRGPGNEKVERRRISLTERTNSGVVAVVFGSLPVHSYIFFVFFFVLVVLVWVGAVWL